MGTQQFNLRWNNHQRNLLSVFDQLLQNEAFVDVTLACEGLSIKAHKMVLSACSPYFQSLFIDNPCQHPIVILKDIKFAELKSVVDFMYKGEVNVNHDQLPALLKTAETLRVKGLAEVSGNKNSEVSEQKNDEVADVKTEIVVSSPTKKKRRLLKRKKNGSDDSDGKNASGGESGTEDKPQKVTRDEEVVDLETQTNNESGSVSSNDFNDNAEIGIDDTNNSWNSDSTQHITSSDLNSKPKSTNEEGSQVESSNGPIMPENLPIIPPNLASWAAEQFLSPLVSSSLKKRKSSTVTSKLTKLNSLAEESKPSNGSELEGIKDELFRCTLCSKTFSESKSLIEHSNLHLQRFECDVCGTCFANQRDLRRHEHRHIPIHLRKPQFECQECGKRFHNQGSLVNHRNVHKQRFKCDLCGHCSQSKVMLEKHMRIHL